MKTTRRMLGLLCGVMLFLCLAVTGCHNCDATPDTAASTTTTTTTTTSTTTTKNWSVVREGKFPELNMDFCSGVGAWMTSLEIHEDGSFSGLFNDSDMGNSGDNYPDGTRYTCSFTGRFEITSVTDNTATLKMTDLTYAEEKDTVSYADDVRYIAADAYGLAGHTAFVLYLPNTPTADLPEDAKSWTSGYGIGQETIDCFALYCPETGHTFFGN